MQKAGFLITRLIYTITMLFKLVSVYIYFFQILVLGKSDPYCEVSMGSQEHKTKVISNNLNPKWNASMQFSIQNVDTDTLCITVFDRDLFSPNGKSVIDCSCPIKVGVL